MVYLPAGLGATRSRNAQQLSQNQQAMGVVPSERPAAPPQPGGGVAPSTEGGFTPGGQSRPSRMTEYFQQQEQQRGMLAARGEDLRLAQLMSRALDPAMPKGFRQLGLKQVSQMLGIDPRGDRAKEMINTISGLDPQSLEGLRRGVVTATNEAEPGEVSQTVRGVLTGQVPPDQLLQMAQAAIQPPVQQEQLPQESPVGPPSMLGGPRAAGGLTGADAGSTVTEVQAPGQGAGPGSPLPPRDQGPARMPLQAAPTSEVPRYDERAISPRMREIEPDVASILGLDLNQPYRLIDVARAGWDRIPPSTDARERMMTEIKGNQAGVVDTITMASQLASLVRGRPEALNAFSIRPPWGGDPITLNVPSVANQINDFVRGLGTLGGITMPTARELSEITSAMEADPKTRAMGSKIAGNIQRWMTESGVRVEDAAELNARINGLMVPLAFAMAAAKGQTGRFLSDRDVALQLQELGNSASPGQFEASIRDMVGRIWHQYNSRMRVQTGAEIPIAHVIPAENAQIISDGGIAPGSLLSAMGITSAAAQPTARRVQTQPVGRAPPPTAGPGFSLNIGGESTEMPPGPVPGVARPAAPTQAAAPAPAPLNYNPSTRRRTLERITPTIEGEEAGALKRQEQNAAAQLEQRSEGRRRLEIAESQEARAQRQESEQRRARIQQAFASIGAALRGAISGGGGGSVGGGGGGDQDPAAFRISPPPQRRPPTPVPAAPFQPQLPQQRRR